MKVALIHDWLTGMRGGEMVLEELCKIFPKADIYTLIHIKGSVSKTIESHTIKTSFLQKFPMIEKKYRWFLPLMPRAIESLKLTGYDLLISSSHCVAKGVRTGGAPHICYCHTPMRYAWDMYDNYFNRERISPLTLLAIEKIMPRLRQWDIKTLPRVTRFVANSHYVQERIKRIYNADAEVIYPPVDTDFYTPASGEPKREKYLIVSAFAPYKRIDLAVETFNELRKPLLIIGKGEDEARLRRLAGPTIIFEPPVPKERLRELYGKAKALIFPGEEDFGIIPVEAMACGAPVIAYGKGGAMESVTPLRDQMTKNPTGLFFGRQTKEELIDAIERFESSESSFHPEMLRANALRFGKEVFRKKIGHLIESNFSVACAN